MKVYSTFELNIIKKLSKYDVIKPINQFIIIYLTYEINFSVNFN